MDGCDASADMIERCRRRAPDATLWVSRLHELNPPRPYASIICSGVFGLGSTREQDIQAIERLHAALVPGGTLVLDNEETPFRWRVRDWGKPTQTEISLCSRVDAVDEDDLSVQMTLRATAPDGRSEEHTLTMRHWYRDQLIPLFGAAGFANVEVISGVDENTLVYVCTRPI